MEETGGILKKIKITALSVLLGLIISTVVISITAAVAANVDMPHSLFSAFSTIALTLGCVGAGFMSGAINRSRGIINGLIAGGATYILLFAISFAVIGEIGLVAIFKLIICLVSGIIGGILGVNKR
ncbi:MAG: TIGR04086 family membrane protein [Oscillospiraceae bacterium]|nr:TIGR04086 family membrane protein [Oscillospiraceae bacterium]